MSGTRKDRRQWNRKERNRTNEADPAAVKLHRTRVLEHIQARERVRTGYQACVFQTRLQIREEGQTAVCMNDTEREILPYRAHDPRDAQWVLEREKPDLNVSAEEELLKAHVDRARFTSAKHCHLQSGRDGIAVCESAFMCRFRTWDEILNGPRCSLKQK